MGKADVNVNIWLSEKKRFANLFNGVIYGGRQVILPEDLEEVNPVSSVSVKNRTGKTKNMKKYRDIIMKWRNQATFVLLANESQDMVHYAMPHKVMLYDGMDYETQIRNNWKNFNDRRKQNKKTGQPLEHLTAGEYLSRFRKKDRLIPIISLVFYYGSEPWDGPVDLYDMFQLEGTKEEKEVLEKYLPNYKINLIDSERLPNISQFSEDLQVILSMLRYRNSKEELTDYINENKKFFQNVDYETSQAMKAFLNMKQISGETEQNEEKEMNVVEALDELQRKARHDDKLREQFIKTRDAEDPLGAFCSVCREAGYELYPMDVVQAGDEFYAAMKRSTNGGGENSPVLTGEDDPYELFFAGLQEL